MMRTRNLLITMILPALMLPALAQGGTLSAGLERQMQGKSGEDVLTVLVVLEDQPDIRTLDQELRSAKASLAERHERVVTLLQETARSTQTALRADLDRATARGEIEGYTPYWIMNAIVVRGPTSFIRGLAARSDIAIVEANLVIESIEPVDGGDTPSATKGGTGTTPGIEAIKVPQVWKMFGLDGSGVVVANIDSGVDGTHEALAARWRGNFAPPAECWLDVGGVGSPDFPVDYIHHGTHVMGTLTGWTKSNQIGVAPGALWIAANPTYDNGPHQGFDNEILASFEFMTDPDGDPETIDDVPAVVQNSWGVREGVGDYIDCDTRWWDVIDNCEAAGVVVIISAGNDAGSPPLPGTLRSPADRASSPTNSFAVGATAQFAPYPIWAGSSRGPSRCGGDYTTKPEVVAPGLEIYSAIIGGYDHKTGTSFAGPHVSGVVALMRDADPDVDVVTIKEILMDTAHDLGPAGEDNTYGHGFVDAYLAVAAVVDDVGTLEITVVDRTTDEPVPGAQITVEGTGLSYTSDEVGTFDLPLPPGAYSVVVAEYGYHCEHYDVEIRPGARTPLDCRLANMPTSTLCGYVRDIHGQPVQDASITVLDTPIPAQSTDIDGYYSFALVAGAGVTYTVEADAGAMGRDYETVTFEGNTNLDLTVNRGSTEDFESGNLLSWPWGFIGMEIDSEVRFEGAHSVRSEHLELGGYSIMNINLEVLEPGTIRFRYRTPSPNDHDILLFSSPFNDDALLYSEPEWTEFSSTVDQGECQLTWSYWKLGSSSQDEVHAWIDFIEFPESVIPLRPSLELSVTELTAYVPTGGTRSKFLTLHNVGDAQLVFDASVPDGLPKRHPLVVRNLVRDLAEGIDLPVSKAQLLEIVEGDARSPDPVKGGKDGLPLPWVSISPESGEISSGQSKRLIANFIAGGLVPGIYETDLTIETNDPYNTTVIVPLTMYVGLVRQPDVGPDEFAFDVTPNPFNPETDLGFVLQQDGRASLEIYDLAGRLIATLADGPHGPGPHRYAWRGLDTEGHPVSSGTYLARLCIDGRVAVKRLALIR